MGLLDDAIRQHLELKRAHGADPSDVARLEHEAFGPIEREDALAVAPAEEPRADAATHDVAAEEELAYEEAELEAEEEWAAAPAPPAPVAEAPPTEVVAPREPVAPVEPPAPTPPAPAAAEPPAAPVDALRPGGSVRLDDVGERTVEFSAVEPPRHAPDPQPDAEPGEHDELEETPEFLQETPEHDRLWFEQKPPRDFDF